MRPTIYTVAQRAGVSIATVSRVLNNPTLVKAETKAKVLQAMEALGYRPSACAHRQALRARILCAYHPPRSREYASRLEHSGQNGHDASVGHQASRASHLLPCQRALPAETAHRQNCGIPPHRGSAKQLSCGTAWATRVPNA